MSFGKCCKSRLAVACGNSTLKIGFSIFHGLPTFSHGLRLIWGIHRTGLCLLARAPSFSGKWISSATYYLSCTLSTVPVHTYRGTRSSFCFADGQYTTSAVVLLHRRTRRGSFGGNGHRRSSRSKLYTYWSESFALAGRWGWERRGVEEQDHEEPFYGGT
jgi:hypothetical protein